METVKAGQPLIDLIKLCYEANQPVLLEGPHGIGKSEILEQAAKALKIKFLSRDLSLMEPPDLVGLPKAEKQTTVYLPPRFLPTSGNGLLVFEELNRCERYMRGPCLQLLTARMLNDYKLPPGWLPVAAINPTDGDYEVSELDPALLSRFARVHVLPDPAEWLNWAERHGVHSKVTHYVASDETVFNTPESSPRSWVYVSKVLKASERQEKPSPRTLRAAVIGLVGSKRGAAFLRTLTKTEQPLTAEEILDSYQKHRKEVQGWVRDGRLDLVEPSLHSLLKYIQPKANFEELRASETWWNNMERFLSDLPGDLREMAESFFADRNYVFPKSKRQNTKTKKKVTP